MMDFWKETRKLKIYFEGEASKPDKVEYRLYEPNFISAMNYIFRLTLEEEADNREDDREKKLHLRKCNILSFIGARGAGKTTAMGEFCRILRDMKRDEVKDWWVERVTDDEEDRKALLKKNFHFHVLDPIDASLLTDSDDLFELILSGIYHEYEIMVEQSGGYGMRCDNKSIEINRLFDELLEIYRSSSKERKKWQEDYTICTVKRILRGSSLIAKNIGEIIEKLTVLNQEKGREYFVIVIDDLDLNLKAGYKMLEQLQKYFTDPRILILVTMDYDQMWRVCAEYFHRKMQETDNDDAANGIHSHLLANDFMTKVFPLPQRLFLPDMKKQGNRMLIQMGSEADIHIKKLIMEKVADRMRIYYDAKGSKRHFCEPDTIRKLVDYNDFLDSLLPVNFDDLVSVEQLSDQDDDKRAEENKKILRKYDQNHNRFNWDIMERQAQTTLNVYQHAVFRQLLDFPLERRMVYFVKSVKDSDTKEIQLVDVNKEDCAQYSYGDCLEQIYEWGRKEYANKSFISCVLASFTSEMVREYVNFRYLKDPARREHSKERLRAFLGISFSNEWVIEGLFPKGITEVNWGGKSVRIGYDRKASNCEISFLLDDLRVLKAGPRKGMVDENELRIWLEKTGIVETLECIDMFLNAGADGGYLGPKPQFTLGGVRFGERDDETRKKKYIIVKYADHSVMDIMGFVGKSMDYGMQKKVLRDHIVKGINSALSEYFTGKTFYDLKKMKKLLETIIDDYSIFKKDWDESLSLEAALPFYELDLMYNVIKRIRKKKMELIQKEKVYEEMLNLYQCIEDALKEQEGEYSYAKMEYSKIFAACPYIKALRRFQEEKKDEIMDRIVKVLYEVSSLGVGEPPEPRD